MKKALILLLAFCMIFALTACGKTSNNSATSEKQPIKIGFVAPFTGVSAPSGIDLRDGFLLYLQQHDNILGGHKIDFYTEDDTADAGTGVQKARKLVEQDGVSLIAGPAQTPVAYAIAEYTIPIKVPLLLNGSTGDAHTKQNYNDYVLRVGWSASQAMAPLADYAYNVLGYRKMACMAMDNGFGQETMAVFQYEFERLGGKITARIWNPNACLDFAPYLAQIPTDGDAIAVTEAGGDGVNFFPAYRDYGLTLPILASGSTTDESLLPAIGDPGLGVLSCCFYSAALDTPENKAFVDAYTKAYNRTPGWNAEAGYVSAQVLDGIFDLMPAGFDLDTMLNNFKGYTGVWPRGPVTIDNYNHPIQNMYIREVQNVNGVLQNTVIKTYEKVSQFWVWDPTEMLAQPPFSKDFPPFNS